MNCFSRTRQSWRITKRQRNIIIRRVAGFIYFIKYTNVIKSVSLKCRSEYRHRVSRGKILIYIIYIICFCPICMTDGMKHFVMQNCILETACAYYQLCVSLSLLSGVLIYIRKCMRSYKLYVWVFIMDFVLHQELKNYILVM